MKRFLKFVPAIFALCAAVAFSSCTKNYYETGIDVDVVWYYPTWKDFSWDTKLERWQWSKSDPNLTVYQVDDMEIAGTVVFGNDFCPMPYTQTYWVDFSDGTSDFVVQTIGFEVTYGKVTFYIQSNYPNVTREFMEDEYEFKISQFYRK